MSILSTHKAEIPFFSVPDVNKASDYLPFRNVIEYLKSRSERFKNKHELLLRCGYGKSSYSKFCIREAGWITLKRNVPLKYLEAIGAELAEIEKAVALDRESYENILTLQMPNPKVAVVRLMAAAYSEYVFEPGTTENQAIELLKEFSKENNLRTCLKLFGIKSIFVEPSGEVKYSFYYPILRLTKTELVPSFSGQGIGNSYLT